MKKEVTYYLEDTSRLNEISQSDLEAWIAEMPFHQPLQLLASIKSEMDGPQNDENPKVYAAYFAEDYEAIHNTRSRKKNQRKKNNGQAAKAIVANTKSDQITTQENKESAPHPTTVVAPDLSIDTKEEKPNNEEAQPSEAPKVKGEVTSNLADELLEEEIITEVLEENISEDLAPDVNAIAENNIIEEIKKDSEEKSDTEELTPEKIEVNQASKVDYSEYSTIAPKKGRKPKSSQFQEEESSNEPNPNELQPDSSHEEIDEIAVGSSSIGQVQKKKKSKKKKKKKKNKEKISKPKEEKSLEKKLTKGKSKKKKKKEKTKKKKKPETLTERVQKSKKKKNRKKTKIKKEDKQIEYVIVDSSKDSSFTLNDYDGISNYTSWLLEQESINDAKKERNKIPQVKMKKSKTKKSKKKKKPKTLKIAVDSIKKQDTIISEPLANILAAQGHKKKARKMYAKLAYVFPEKKAYFEQKMEALKT